MLNCCKGISPRQYNLGLKSFFCSKQIEVNRMQSRSQFTFVFNCFVVNFSDPAIFNKCGETLINIYVLNFVSLVR